MSIATVITICLLVIEVGRCYVQEGGMLYPKESETRQVVSLDGLWDFVVSPITDPLIGFREYWSQKDLKKLKNVKVHKMPVPASYNDISVDPKIRDHLGLAWYDRTFYVPKSWSNNSRVWLRFSSVSYAAQVWINGELVMSHEIGHLPFHREISSVLIFGGNNRVTVACDNTLLPDTIPQGKVDYLQTDTGKRLVQYYTFDFYNYAGIHRPVVLYTTPRSYIDDITINTDIEADIGIVDYNISVIGIETVLCRVKLIDRDNVVVAKDDGSGATQGILLVSKANFWWPYLMHPEPGYLYTLQVELVTVSGEVVDVYRHRVGIRNIVWTNTTILINGRQIYMHGFGRHEDTDIRGKGLDIATVLRDYSLIKWIGANTYRTSHYPYADEIMDLADEMGIMIINECPSVNTETFSAALLSKHKDSLTELIRRDKNRPSVIMWSIANEPRTQFVASDEYFKSVVEHVKSLDTTRPTTIAIAQSVDVDYSAKHIDIISFNRYNGWYSNSGSLDTITFQVIAEATAWHTKHKKPVLMSEYGADTVEGLHLLPSYVWTEEYQIELMSKHFEAFDKLRAQGFFIGEFIWNFADFKTAQTYTRVGGNKKGIFTRNREPKCGAHHLRKRYWGLAKHLYNVSMPVDLVDYIFSDITKRDEL